MLAERTTSELELEKSSLEESRSGKEEDNKEKEMPWKNEERKHFPPEEGDVIGECDHDGEVELGEEMHRAGHA